MRSQLGRSVGFPAMYLFTASVCRERSFSCVWERVGGCIQIAKQGREEEEEGEEGSVSAA